MISNKALHVAVGFITDSQGRWLLTQRAKHVHQGGLWEFPGGKLEPGETAYEALCRELHEEVGIVVEQAEPLIQIRHQYPDLDVLLDVWRVTAFSGQAHAREGQALSWVSPHQLADYPLPAANGNIVKAAQSPSFYPILEADHPANLLVNLQCILDGGARLLQFRAKGIAVELRAELLQQVLNVCGERQVDVLVNSDLALSVTSPQGLHLSGHALANCQQKPAGFRWVAASCHTLEDLKQAEQLDLDFAVLAPVLPTATHPDAQHLGWTLVAQWLQQVNLPVYLMGGLDKADLPQSLAAGAQGVAGIRAFLN